MRNSIHYTLLAVWIWDYIVLELQNRAAADRVLYGRRDYLNVLFREFPEDTTTK